MHGGRYSLACAVTYGQTSIIQSITSNPMASRHAFVDNAVSRRTNASLIWISYTMVLLWEQVHSGLSMFHILLWHVIQQISACMLVGLTCHNRDVEISLAAVSVISQPTGTDNSTVLT